MAKTDNLTDFLTDVANAIREKKGTTEPINPQNFSDEIASIKSGSSEPIKEKSVNFWDYDGTLLYSYTINEAKAMTKLPNLPTHEEQNLFYASDWSETLENVNNVFGFLDVYANYKPIDTTYSYCSIFYFDISSETLTLTVNKSSSSVNAVIHWGDGTTTTITTTTSSQYSHTYEKKGKYNIVVVSSGGINLGYDSSKCFITKAINRQDLLSCYLSSSTTLKNYAFYLCYSLKYVFGGSTDNSGTYVYNSCNTLKLVCNKYSINSNGRYNCYSIEREELIGTHNSSMVLASCVCKKLKVTTYAITKVPPSVRLIFLTHSSVPTLSATIPCSTYGTEVYVRDELVESYKTASKWSDIANYIFPISEYTDEYE